MPRFAYLSRVVERARQMIGDYMFVADEIARGSSQRPLKTVLGWSVFAGIVIARSTRPDQKSYTDAILRHANELALVPSTQRSRKAENAIVSVQSAVNSGSLQVVDVGLASLVFAWDRTVDECSLYGDTCKHVQPGPIHWRKYVVDVGVFDRWLMLEQAVENYDVNDEDMLP